MHLPRQARSIARGASRGIGPRSTGLRTATIAAAEVQEWVAANGLEPGPFGTDFAQGLNVVVPEYNAALANNDLAAAGAALDRIAVAAAQTTNPPGDAMVAVIARERGAVEAARNAIVRAADHSLGRDVAGIVARYL